jgi:hypothetical protein
MIFKLLGPEVDIGTTANSVSSGTLVRIINTGARASANVAYANGTVYANVTVSNTESVVIQKTSTDLVKGANMLAVPIAFRN